MTTKIPDLLEIENNGNGHMYTIKAVAIKTGLTTHTIRVWERRYEIIVPVRTETNRRLYSEDEVQKLILLRKATQAGHSIGQLAKMPFEEIERLVNEQKTFRLPSKQLSYPLDEKSPDFFVDAALAAAADFDNEALDNLLTQASVNFSRPVLIDQVIVPFLDQLGDKWFDGDMRIAQEHAASAVVRTFLGRLLSSIHILEQGPTLVTATVSGLFHEFGAILVALSAATQGWRAHYLGPNLPVEEIVFSTQKMNAKAVVISIVYPPGDDLVREQLLHLRRLLLDDIAILVGGRSADSYMSALSEINAIVCSDMADLRAQLLTLQMDYKNSI